MFDKILSRIGLILGKYNLPYMIIGGQAVLLYGEPRLTRDIDITLGVNIDCLDKLMMAINEIPLTPLPENIPSFVRETMVLPALDEQTGIRVDFIFSFTTYETAAIERARKVKIMDQDINFASAEDIIVHKIFAGRPRDMEDVRTIILKNQNLDFGYMRTWLKEFDLSSDENSFLIAFESILKKYVIGYR